MADTRFDQFRDTDVLVTLRVRYMMSASGWHDFRHSTPLDGEDGFSVPDAAVLDMTEAPPHPDPDWEKGDVIMATYAVRNTDDGHTEIRDLFEYVDNGPPGREWRWIREDTIAARERLTDVVPLARHGEPWPDG